MKWNNEIRALEREVQTLLSRFCTADQSQRETLSPNSRLDRCGRRKLFDRPTSMSDDCPKSPSHHLTRNRSGNVSCHQHASQSHTHHALLFADIFQFDLRVLQLLGESRLNGLGLQPPHFALLKLIADTERVWMYLKLSRRWRPVRWMYTWLYLAVQTLYLLFAAIGKVLPGAVDGGKKQLGVGQQGMSPLQVPLQFLLHIKVSVPHLQDQTP